MGVEPGTILMPVITTTTSEAFSFTVTVNVVEREPYVTVTVFSPAVDVSMEPTVTSENPTVVIDPSSK